MARFGENTADDHNGVTKDTYLRGPSYADTNYGTSTMFRVRNNTDVSLHTRKSVLKYDLSAISGQTVTAVTFNIWIVLNQTININLWSCVRDWVELTATWNKYDGVNPWGADHDRDRALHSFNTGVGVGYYFSLSSAALTAYIQDVLNGVEGVPADTANLLLYGPWGNTADFTSSDGTDGHRPYLDIISAAPVPAGGALASRTGLRVGLHI